MALFVPGIKPVESVVRALGETPDANYLWCRQIMKPRLYSFGRMASVLNRYHDTSWGTRNVVVVVTKNAITLAPATGFNYDEESMVLHSVVVNRADEEQFQVTEKNDTTQFYFVANNRFYAFVVSKRPVANGDYILKNLKALKANGFDGRVKPKLLTK
ncbi:hypothetical protein PQ472_11780 [Lacticaseibacillus pabuli]|uniref:Uncharacterized protein n=1 Tax=Lacticaseibacillus pabuli TaxID=3025672 RepID=A0ABY7WS44_9LACO|nr:hypothetical protein [Lacticaseibacillus sp. KACC 23028]WDF82556.1 hypothetical protein PQ472_11780 [Lacticaseibacillus sp. KACC 23028]